MRRSVDSSPDMCPLKQILLVVALQLASRTHAQSVADDCMATGNACSDKGPRTFQYCVIGAGPAGIQLGHLFHSANRSYRVFDQADSVGSFFRKYPVHRKLISVNKKYTGRSNSEYNMRHDWNSLLNNDKVPKMPTRTSDRFPDADVLVSYFEDFAREQVESGHIELETKVGNIRKAENGQFELSLQKVGSLLMHKKREMVFCQVLVVATGIGTPRVPPIDGIELARGYIESSPYESQHRFDGSGEQRGQNRESPVEHRWAGKTIGIFGAGNAAFEIADAASNHASWVHMFGLRKQPPRRRFSWETRYSGGLRATRISLLDGYLLKSGDLFSDTGVDAKEIMIRKCKYKRCGIPVDDNVDPFDTLSGQLVMFKSYSRPKCGAKMVQIGEFTTSQLDEVQVVLEKWSKQVNVTPSDWELSFLDPKEFAVAHSSVQESSDVRSGAFHAKQLLGLAIPTELVADRVDALVQLRNELGNLDFTDLYDELYYATGWLHDFSVYDKSIQPKFQSNSRLPQLGPGYESTTKDLYFAGTLAHGFDLRRGAGGFIGGFRYSARALFRHLDLKYEGKPWPRSVFRVASELDELAEKLLYRINTAGGPYQMVYTIGDCINFEKLESGEIIAVYREEVPFHLAMESSTSATMYWTFGFEFGQVASLLESLGDGTGFRPFITYWECGNGNLRAGGWQQGSADQNIDIEERHQNQSRRKLMFRLNESYNFKWGVELVKEALKSWLAAIFKQMMLSGSACALVGDVVLDDIVPDQFDHAVVDLTPGSFELDVIFVNTFNDQSVYILPPEIDPLATGASRTVERELIELGPLEATQRQLTFDGETWKAKLLTADGSVKERQWIAVIEAGVFQEVNIGPETFVNVMPTNKQNLCQVEVERELSMNDADLAVGEFEDFEFDDFEGPDENNLEDCAASVLTLNTVNNHQLDHCKELLAIEIDCSDGPLDEMHFISMPKLVKVAGDIQISAAKSCHLSVDFPKLRHVNDLLINSVDSAVIESINIPRLCRITGNVVVRVDSKIEASGPHLLTSRRSLGDVWIGGKVVPLSIDGVVNLTGKGHVHGLHIDNCNTIGKAKIKDVEPSAVTISNEIFLDEFDINRQASPQVSLHIWGNVHISLTCGNIGSMEIRELRNISGSLLLHGGGTPTIKLGGHAQHYPEIGGEVLKLHDHFQPTKIKFGYYGKHSARRTRSVLIPPQQSRCVV